MLCFDHPCDPQDPYPPPGTTVGTVMYLDDLVLFRPKDRLLSSQDGSLVRPTQDVCLTGAPFSVRWFNTRAKAFTFTVPAGFITDLTSVPMTFRFLVGRVGPWLEAAILHDLLYVAWQDVPGRGHREADRLFAENIMRVAMVAADVPDLQRSAIYAMVRTFGASAFHRVSPMRYANCKDDRLKKAS